MKMQTISSSSNQHTFSKVFVPDPKNEEGWNHSPTWSEKGPHENTSKAVTEESQAAVASLRESYQEGKKTGGQFLRGQVCWVFMGRKVWPCGKEAEGKAMSYMDGVGGGRDCERLMDGLVRSGRGRERAMRNVHKCQWHTTPPLLPGNLSWFWIPSPASWPHSQTRTPPGGDIFTARLGTVRGWGQGCRQIVRLVDCSSFPPTGTTVWIGDNLVLGRRDSSLGLEGAELGHTGLFWVSA
jgi:hypothetical protein